MIDKKYKDILVKSAKAILAKSSCFTKGTDDARNNLPKNCPYLNLADATQYYDGWETAEAAKDDLAKFMSEQKSYVE